MSNTVSTKSATVQSYRSEEEGGFCGFVTIIDVENIDYSSVKFQSNSNLTHGVVFPQCPVLLSNSADALQGSWAEDLKSLSSVQTSTQEMILIAKNKKNSPPTYKSL